MKFATRVGRPGPLFTAGAAIAVVAAEGTVDGTALGVLGALAGMFLELGTLQLGMLIVAASVGVRVHDVVIGIGARLWENQTSRRTVSLRVLPVVLSVGIGPGASPARPRMWATALAATVLGTALAVTDGLLATGPFSRGVAIGAWATLLFSMLPRRNAASTSVGWLLFALPRLPRHRVAEWAPAPLVNQALDAVNAGDLDTAEHIAAELTRSHPALRSTTATRVAVLEARARYAEALALTIGLVADPTQEPRDLAVALAGLAGLTAAAIEAGQLDAAAGMGTARQATVDAERLGYPGFRLNGTKALLELLEGRPDRAARLALLGAKLDDQRLSRADDLATLARALMASGDNRAARVALVEAEKLAAWWPRVATTRARLSIC